MPRSVFDQELQRLQEQIVRLGTQVDHALKNALTALESHDRALCDLVIAADAAIDALRAEIEQQAFQLLTLQQPLGGRDVRLLTATITLVGDLERSGDGAAGIAKLLLRMFPLPEAGPLSEEVVALNNVLALGQEAQRVLHATVQAFSTLDVRAARYYWQEDDVVDVRYHMIRHDLMTLLQGNHALPALKQDTLIMQRITYLLWIAHKLERIADHCGNVCERIVFIVEGDAAIASPDE
jgi:phosphate transport system protein